MLYLHGGGHVSGSPTLYGDFTWRIAAATRARTVILDHRLAPEHPFPAALDDAVTAYRFGLPANRASSKTKIRSHLWQKSATIPQMMIPLASGEG